MITGPLPPSAGQIELFNKQVDQVAVILCEELGLNPHDTVCIEYGADATPYEDRWSSHSYGGHTHQMNVSVHYPADGSPPYMVAPTGIYGSYGTVSVSAPNAPATQSVPMWRKFRRQAAIQLAGWRAVNRWALTSPDA